MAQVDLNSRESLEARIRSIAESVASSMGMEIVLTEIKGAGNRSIVRAYIDQPGGMSLKDCERFSKRLTVLLDVEDFIPFSYILEVSSPGLDRPLVRETDYQRFAGRRAKLRTLTPVEGQRNFKAKILGINNGLVQLETTPGKHIEVAFTDIEKANLVIEI